MNMYNNFNNNNGMPYADYNNGYNNIPPVYYDNQFNNAPPVFNDSEYRKEMKKKLPIIILITFLYSLFYSWGLYDSKSGIMAALFTLLTVAYFFAVKKLTGVSAKRINIIFILSMILLGISQFLTDSSEVHFYNSLMFILVTTIWLINSLYDCKKWSLGMFIESVAYVVIGCLKYIFASLKDIFSIFKRLFSARWDEKRKQNMKSVLTGLIVGIPLVAFIVILLNASDAVFKNMVSGIHFAEISDKFKIIILMTVCLVIYLNSFIVALLQKRLKCESKAVNKKDAVIAITVFLMLTVIYLVFSFIQIGALMLKKMQLPDGCTYAEYAREGFFSLLFVCFLNLIFVIIGKIYFRENLLLKILMHIVCACTFIMISASAIKMYMYITAYGMSRLRFKVILALVVITLIMLGIIIWLNINKFPILKYSAVVFLGMYMIFSFCKPDYLIAKYNLEHFGYVNFSYSEIVTGSESSLDAVPAVEEFMEENAGYKEDLFWVSAYEELAEVKNRNMKIKDFNYSIYQAGNYFKVR